MSENLAKMLLAARREGHAVEEAELGVVGTLADGFDVQARQAGLCGHDIVGWKLGATAQAPMDLLGLEEPFLGPIYDIAVVDNGAKIPISAAHKNFFESEIALVLGQFVVVGIWKNGVF